MPDDTKHVWVDTSFFEPLNAEKNINAQLQLISADNIGSYSLPVIYTQEEAEVTTFNINTEYFNESISISGVNNIPVEHFNYEPPKIDEVLISLVEFSKATTTSGVLDKDILYTTGYNSISGSLDKRVTFVGGAQYEDVVNVPAYFSYFTSESGIIEWWVNYTNFSGDVTVSGIPVPFHNGTFSYTAEYFSDFGVIESLLDEIVDISFAGWVNFPIISDVYSTNLNCDFGYDFEVATISGNVGVNYLDLISSVLTFSGVECDVYCALTDYESSRLETEVIPGRINNIDTDIYSSLENKNGLILDVSLYSLKIANFSLDIGGYTQASNSIYVDVTDDICPVSTSGTYFVVDDIKVSVTFSGIDYGYRMFYDSLDDFISLEGPTVFTVHAENECGQVLEQDFYLTFGYIVEYINSPDDLNNIDYGYNNKVAVRVTAEDYASCPQVNSLAWAFESRAQYNRDLGASITGRFHAWDYSDMSAKIYPLSTAYFYGKQFTVIINTKDFAGNQMEPLILTYRIEDKP